VIPMKCFERDVLFSYARQELEPRAKAEIEQHLRDCARCRKQLETLAGRIALVKEHVAALDPAIVPLQPNLTGAGARQRVHLSMRPPTVSPLHFPAASVWRAAAISVCAVVALITSIQYFRQVNLPGDSSPAGIAAPGEWLDDPQRDWDEKRVIIQIVDPQARTVEMVRTSLIEKNIRRATFPQGNPKTFGVNVQ
jgi:anti-sigma factor RsiW